MTKAQLEIRNEDLVRICNKETDRADRAEELLKTALLVIPERHEELIALIKSLTKK